MPADLIRDPDGDGNRLALSGDLTSKTARALFAQTPAFSGEEITVDIHAVREVDSSGLALLLHWSHLARAASGKLTFTGAPAQAREMAKITGLEDLLSE